MRFCLFLIIFLLSNHPVLAQVTPPENGKSRFYNAETIAITISKKILLKNPDTASFSSIENYIRAAIITEAYQAADNWMIYFQNKMSANASWVQRRSIYKMHLFGTYMRLKDKSKTHIDSLVDHSFEGWDIQWNNEMIKIFQFDTDNDQDILATLYDNFQYSKDSLELMTAYLNWKIDQHFIGCIAERGNMQDRRFYDIDEKIINVSNDKPAKVLIIRLKNQPPLPAVYRQTIYTGPNINKAKVAAMKGYVSVIGHTAGVGFKGYNIIPFETEAADTYLIIDMLSQHPWINGTIGMYGGSYLGTTQWAALKKKHPALRTIVPQVAVRPGIDFPLNAGIWMSYGLRWIQFVCNNSEKSDVSKFLKDSYWDNVYKRWYASKLPFSFLDSIEGKTNSVFQKWVKQTHNPSFWEAMTISRRDMSSLDIPILSITGYYDDDQWGAVSYYRDHVKANPHNNHYLVVGPWDHFGSQSKPQKNLLGYAIDSVAAIDIDALVFDWFDYILKGKNKPAFLKNRVNMQIMGANKWKSAKDLTSLADTTLRYYPFTQKNDQTIELGIHKPKNYSVDIKGVNLDDRSDTAIFNNEDEDLIVRNDPIYLERYSANYINFFTDTFTTSFHIAGAIAGELLVETDLQQPQFNFVVYLQRKDGKYHLLSLTRIFSNHQQAAYTHSPSTRKVHKIDIPHTVITAIQCEPGSRLVFQLGYDKNPYWVIPEDQNNPSGIKHKNIIKGEAKIRLLPGTHFSVPVSKVYFKNTD